MRFSLVALAVQAACGGQLAVRLRPAMSVRAFRAAGGELRTLDPVARHAPMPA